MSNKLTLIHCSYHKCLTGYYARVMGAMFNKLMPWSGGYRHFDSDIDLYYENFTKYKVSSVNNHFLDLSRLGDYRITRFIRDPRDMIVSGYFYHKRGAEDWCNVVSPDRNSGKISSDIILDAMGTKHSFSTYLQSMNEEDGLIAEIEFRRKHFNSILEWPDNDKNIRLYKYEDILGNEEEVYRDMFKFYELSTVETFLGSYFSRRYSASNQKGKIKHIRNPESNQWKKHFTPRVQESFNEFNSELLTKLGYEIE